MPIVYHYLMIVAKQVADLLSVSRVAIAPALAWVGLTQGADGVRVAAALLLLSWVTDGLDGPLARRSSRQYRSWIGEHDLQFDMLVSLGVLAYLTAAGFVSMLMAGSYVLVWALIFVARSGNRSLGMLFQAPIYGTLLWVVAVYAPSLLLYLVGFLVLLVLVTWPRFLQQVVPGFLGGLLAAQAREPTDLEAPPEVEIPAPGKPHPGNVK